MASLLASAQVLLGLAQDLAEQLVLGGEVPVEDALADPEAVDDLGDRGGVVAMCGEAWVAKAMSCAAALRAALGQPSGSMGAATQGPT